jgi:hypothetical protein
VTSEFCHVSKTSIKAKQAFDFLWHDTSKRILAKGTGSSVKITNKDGKEQTLMP